MSQKTEKSPLWQPSATDISDSNLSHYLRWLQDERGLSFSDYSHLWEWSVENPGDFWHTLWAYFDIIASHPPEHILRRPTMPGAKWFEGAQLNYTENFFARRQLDHPAMIFKQEDRPPLEIYWPEIQEKTAALAGALRRLGVQRGDTVVAYMPNIPETIIALFAVASIGAIWSSCSPDFGSRSVLDRFQQINPKVLLAVDGYRYNGKLFDRRDILAELQAGLPSLIQTVLVPVVTSGRDLDGLSNIVTWPNLLAGVSDPPPLKFEQVPFDHPLWVLYSSGTTGLPKPIVHGHGGILLEHFKMASLHLDLGQGDRFFWYTSTGWMMWNFLIGGLLTGATIVLYDGAPGYPDLYALWQMAAETGITYFGTSAAFISGCMKAGIRPADRFDLSAIRAVGSTGSPLSAEGFEWVYAHVHQELALESVSGGTDLCTAFVGGCRLLPVYAGEIQCAALGARVQAYDDMGSPVIGEVGELVITAPMPSMPLFFWGDKDNQLYTSSYFDTYPGVWRHGDWIEFNRRGGCVIYGRSDSTINRQGIRMGTSEIYRVVESFPEVADSLVIDLELLGRESFLALFVMLREGISLEDDLKRRIEQKIRWEISPRHVPNNIFPILAVPYTLSGKKMEVPVRRILLGQPPEQVINPGAMRNPDSIQYFIDLAGTMEQRE